MSRNEDGSGAPAPLCVGGPEAAWMLGVNRRAVRTLVARGDLESRGDGSGAAARMLIPVRSVERLRSERHSERRGSG